MNSAQFGLFFVEWVVDFLPGMDCSVAIRPCSDLCHWPSIDCWRRGERIVVSMSLLYVDFYVSSMMPRYGVACGVAAGSWITGFLYPGGESG